MARKSGENPLKYLNYALSFGITTVLAIGLGFLGGQWLDSRLGTTPWLAMTGAVLGIATAFKIMIEEALSGSRGVPGVGERVEPQDREDDEADGSDWPRG